MFRAMNPSRRAMMMGGASLVVAPVIPSVDRYQLRSDLPPVPRGYTITTQRNYQGAHGAAWPDLPNVVMRGDRQGVFVS